MSNDLNLGDLKITLQTFEDAPVKAIFNLPDGSTVARNFPGNGELTMRLGLGLGLTHQSLAAAPALEISGTPVLSATEDEAYDGFTATAAGGTEPYVYSLVGTWPAGITINSGTGAVSGTPTESGTFASLSVRVTDAALDTADLSTFTIEVAAETTAPTLSSPTDTETGDTTADLSVSTNEANGTLYWVVSTSSTAPSAAQVKAGQMHTGAAAADSGSQAVSATGVQNASATGLTGATAYFAHFMHEDAAANQSAVTSANGFTTLPEEHWNSVVFLSSFDGADGATTAVDDSNSAHTITFTKTGSGVCEIDTAQSVFGGSSARIFGATGAGDFAAIEIPDHEDFNPSGDFTWEGRFRFDEKIGTVQTLFSKWNGVAGQNSFLIHFRPADNLLRMTYSVDGTNGLTNTQTGWNPTADVWQATAITKRGSDILFHNNGQYLGKVTLSGAIADTAAPFRIGNFGSSTSTDLHGWVDEVRLTKGVARYGEADYTVDTAAFPRA